MACASPSATRTATTWARCCRSKSQVPLATYTGWNLRRRDVGAEGMLASLTGSFLPLPRTRDEPKTSGDPRRAIEERYGTFARYRKLFDAAVRESVRQRYLLEEDAERLRNSRDKVRGLFEQGSSGK